MPRLNVILLLTIMTPLAPLAAVGFIAFFAVVIVIFGWSTAKRMAEKNNEYVSTLNDKKE